MKVLVTGGAGFIGSHVVDKLREKGIEVRIFDLTLPTFRKDIEYYQGTILDKTALNFAMDGVDAVFHLAAIADVKDVFDNPYYSESVNVRGTINVLEAAKSMVKRVIYASTIWVYSDTENEVIEETTLLQPPSHFYTVTKLVGEYYCRSYSRSYGLETTILRYGTPYGPRARETGVIPIFVKKALRGESLPIAGGGSQFRKFIYVEDLAEGTVLALKPIAQNKIYNLDGKEKITIKQIAELLQKIIPNVKIEYIPARPADFSGKEVSCELAKRELGWEPKISFEEGLRRYIDWYKKREEEKGLDLKKLKKFSE